MNNSNKLLRKFIMILSITIVTVIVLLRFRTFRGDNPWSWKEIVDNFWIILLFSIIGSIIVIIKSNDR